MDRPNNPDSFDRLLTASFAFFDSSLSYFAAISFQGDFGEVELGTQRHLRQRVKPLCEH